MWAPAVLLLLSAALLPNGAAGHGHITFPRARNGGSMAHAGNSESFEAFWFSQITEIPGEPTVNEAAYRTINVKVASGADDFTRKMPWRAPGTAPVRGSGCGVAGGSPFSNMTSNGGMAPPGVPQGADFLSLKPTKATRWRRGEVVEVAFAMLANHGGGYSWRLCPSEGNVTEACFQANTMEFAAEEHRLVYGDVLQWGKVRKVPNVSIPLVKVDKGTHPAGSQWARNPIPACLMCDQGECSRKGLSWTEEQYCNQACNGLNMTHCPPGMSQFPEPAAGLSGYFTQHTCDGLTGFNWNIVDKVRVPITVC